MKDALLLANASRKEKIMNLMLKELASINLFVIFIIVFGGIAFLRVAKNRLEE